MSHDKQVSSAAFEDKLWKLALGAGLPPSFLALWTLAANGVSGYLIGLTATLLLLMVGFCAATIRKRTRYQFQTLANLIETMIQGDYSLRGRGAAKGTAQGDLMEIVNRLAQTLADQKLKTRESQLLLTTVTDHIDVAILACDEHGTVSFVNPAGARLLGNGKRELKGRRLQELGLESVAALDRKQLVELTLDGTNGSFVVYSEPFMEAGRNHRLIFITDIQKILRDEERRAWQDLLRVLSHEINNSLSPIASISDTLIRLVDRQKEDAEARQTLTEGLTIVKERAVSLGNFIQRYRELTRLPEPKKKPIGLTGLLESIIPMCSPRTVLLHGQEDITIHGDPDQLQQCLLNLLKNAHEAMEDPSLPIEVYWREEAERVSIHIRDQGPGVANPDNVFVPFYTTKPGGSGIGLALSRQIAFNHDGNLTLGNRSDGPGAETKMTLPHLSQFDPKYDPNTGPRG